MEDNVNFILILHNLFYDYMKINSDPSNTEANEHPSELSMNYQFHWSHWNQQ